MRLLVARRNGHGGWEKAAVLSATSRSLPMPEKHQGQVVGHVARSAWKQFVAEPAARTVFFDRFGYRVDRIIEA